jgi:hypothetical protein
MDSGYRDKVRRMNFRALSLLVVSTASCSLASSESPTGAATEALAGDVSVLYLGDQPVAMVKATGAGPRTDIAVVGVIGQGRGMYEWIEASFDKKHQSKDGAFVSAGWGRTTMRPFTGMQPIDIVISNDGEKSTIHIIASGDVQPTRPTNIVPPQLPPVGTGLPTAIRVGCGGLPDACARVSSVRLGWHDDTTVSDLVFRSADAQDLSFDPAALGPISFVGIEQIEQSQILFSLDVPAMHPVFAGPIVQGQGDATRTVVLSSAQ